MTTDAVTGKRPLWLLIEEKILALTDQDLQESRLENTTHQIAEALDGTGYNVSKEAGHMLQLRAALAARTKIGRPLMKDFKNTFGDINCKGLTGLDFLVDEERARWSEVFRERETAPVNCHTYIDWAAERVLQTIKENKPS